MDYKQCGNTGRGRGVLALSSYEMCPRPGATTVGSWHQIRSHRPNHNPSLGRGKQSRENATSASNQNINGNVKFKSVENGYRETNGINGHGDANNSNVQNQNIQRNMSNGNKQETSQVKNKDIRESVSNGVSQVTKSQPPVVVKEGDLLAKYNYKANPDCPGGFDEVTIKQGERLTLICKGHAGTGNHLWWEVKNEQGETGFVPGNYCMVLEKTPTALPWLENKRLLDEQEQKKMESLATSNKSADKEYLEIFGAPIRSSPIVKQYQSAYDEDKNKPAPKNLAEANKEYYCEICDKNLNGPQPYKMHMSSKAHREEIAYLEEKKNYK